MADETFELIVSDPDVLHGQARFRGTRIPVFVVLDYLADGMSAEEIYADYPSLPEGAVKAALTYASRLAHEELYPLEPSTG